MHWLRKIAAITIALSLVSAAALYLMARKPVPERITYGVSFNTFYAEELGLDPRLVYRAILDDLGVRHLRLVFWGRLVYINLVSFRCDSGPK